MGLGLGLGLELGFRFGLELEFGLANLSSRRRRPGAPRQSAGAMAAAEQPVWLRSSSVSAEALDSHSAHGCEARAPMSDEPMRKVVRVAESWGCCRSEAARAAQPRAPPWQRERSSVLRPCGSAATSAATCPRRGPNV